MEKHRILLLILASIVFLTMTIVTAYTWMKKYTDVKVGSFQPLEVIYLGAK